MDAHLDTVCNAQMPNGSTYRGALHNMGGEGMSFSWMRNNVILSVPVGLDEVVQEGEQLRIVDDPEVHLVHPGDNFSQGRGFSYRAEYDDELAVAGYVPDAE